jgi:hypothetical protein
VHEEPFLDRLLHVGWLRPRGGAGHAERHLRDQVPRRRDAPLGLDLLVDQRIVVLQVCAEAFVGEGGPDDELVNGGRVMGPDGEVVFGESKLVLQLTRVLRVLKVENSAVGVAEAGQARLSVGVKLLRRGNAFHNIGDKIPELEVLVFEEQDEAGGVGAEGGRGVFERRGEDFLDTRVRDGRLGRERVVCAARNDGLEERGFCTDGTHCSMGSGGGGGGCCRVDGREFR